MRRLVLLFASSTTLAVAVLSGASCSAPSTGAPIVTKRYGGGDDPPEAGHSIDGNLTVVDATSGPREDAGPALPGEVFAHTPKTLYKLEPISKTLTRVGNFSCTAGADAAAQDVIDIAVDKGGKMYGTTFQSLLAIDKATAACTIVATATALSFPNSLSFVPAGTVDPAVEALVGFAVDSYVKIDPATGAMTTIGNLNPNALGITFQSSGALARPDARLPRRPRRDRPRAARQLALDRRFRPARRGGVSVSGRAARAPHQCRWTQGRTGRSRGGVGGAPTRAGSRRRRATGRSAR